MFFYLLICNILAVFRPVFFLSFQTDVGGGGGGLGTFLPPELAEYFTNDNETCRVYSISENISFGILHMGWWCEIIWQLRHAVQSAAIIDFKIFPNNQKKRKKKKKNAKKYRKYLKSEKNTALKWFFIYRNTEITNLEIVFVKTPLPWKHHLRDTSTRHTK